VSFDDGEIMREILERMVPWLAGVLLALPLVAASQRSVAAAEAACCQGAPIREGHSRRPPEVSKAPVAAAAKEASQARGAVPHEADLEPIIVNDSDWPPMFFAGAPGKEPGFVKDLLSTCAPASGRTLRFQHFSIKRTLSKLESGDLDLNVFSPSPERREFLWFGQEALFYSEYRPAVLATSKIDIRSLSDFDRLRVGYLDGLSYSKEFKDYIASRAGRGVEAVNDEEAMMRMLLAGRIDVFVNSVPTILWEMKQFEAGERVRIIDFPVKSSEYFVALSKASRRLRGKDADEFLRRLDRCIAELKTDGRYVAILARYGLDKFPLKAPRR
jgi:ABC-type amino acid transport substrate-binding protein